MAPASASRTRATGIRGLVRLLLKLFYREIEVVGLDRVPDGGPVIFVANHGNALVDPALMIAVLPRPPRFLAKHTLWKIPVLKTLLDWSGSIPVYRRSEGGGGAANRETFARCCEELGAGASVALFPEGISHDQPELQPLRTGVARIALESVSRSDVRQLQIVPVGLLFDDKGRFRSRALVVVGEGFGIDSELAAAGHSDRDAVRRLTSQVAGALATVTLNARSWDEQALLESATEIYTQSESSLPGRTGLARGFSDRQTAAEIWGRLQERDPRYAATIRDRMTQYRDALARLGLRDDQVRAFYPKADVVRVALRRLASLLLWSPVAIFGGLVHWLPYRVVAWIASRVENDPDQPATHKMLAGLVVYPVYWALLVAVAALLWGWQVALACAVALPAAGWAALRYFEANLSFLSEVRAFLRLRQNGPAAVAVRHEREALLELLREAPKRAG